ncbi:hypothetical protein [Staphylococcus phage VB-SauS-SA2]|nr:hypothetical protein [Staphylococcus phage VB-SauS-SA2]
MKDREYKDAWQELKEKKIQDYIGNRKIEYRDSYFVKYLESELLEMDKLDGTNEFSNLLSDLEDE